MPQGQRANKLIKMFLLRVRVVDWSASSALLIALICAVAIVSCSDVVRMRPPLDGGPPFRIKLPAPTNQDDLGVAYSGDKNSLDEQKSLILSALQEFCSNNPRECHPGKFRCNRFEGIQVIVAVNYIPRT